MPPGSVNRRRGTDGAQPSMAMPAGGRRRDAVRRRDAASARRPRRVFPTDARPGPDRRDFETAGRTLGRLRESAAELPAPGCRREGSGEIGAACLAIDSDSGIMPVSPAFPQHLPARPRRGEEAGKASP